MILGHLHLGSPYSRLPYAYMLTWVGFDGSQRVGTGIHLQSGSFADVTVNKTDGVYSYQVSGEGQEIVIGEGVSGNVASIAIEIDGRLVATIIPALIEGEEGVTPDNAPDVHGEASLYSEKEHKVLDKKEGSPFVAGDVVKVKVHDLEHPVEEDDSESDEPFVPGEEEYYGYVRVGQVRPFEVVEENKLYRMYLPKDSLVVNSQVVHIEKVGGDDYLRIGAGNWWCLIRCRWDEDVPIGTSVDFFASIVEYGEKYKYSEDTIFSFPVATILAGVVQHAYGQVQINGLKPYSRYVPFEFSVVEYSDEATGGEPAITCRMYTPRGGTVQHNGIILPIENANGCWLPVEINQRYSCYISDCKAYIRARPPLLSHSRIFEVGGVFTEDYQDG